jgi:hypothetical protein
MHTGTVISYFAIWTSLSPLSYHNGSKEPKISKQAVPGKTRDMTLTILETLQIIRKPVNATSQGIIMAAHKIELLIT